MWCMECYSECWWLTGTHRQTDTAYSDQSLPLNTGTLWVLVLCGAESPQAKSPEWHHYHVTLSITRPTSPSRLRNWTYLQKKKHLLNGAQPLHCAWDCLADCARVNNFCNPNFFSPTWSSFPPSLSLWVRMPAYPLSEPVPWMRSVQGEC